MQATAVIKNETPFVLCDYIDPLVVRIGLNLHTDKKKKH